MSDVVVLRLSWTRCTWMDCNASISVALLYLVALGLRSLRFLQCSVFGGSGVARRWSSYLAFYDWARLSVYGYLLYIIMQSTRNWVTNFSHDESCRIVHRWAPGFHNRSRPSSIFFHPAKTADFNMGIVDNVRSPLSIESLSPVGPDAKKPGCDVVKYL